MTRRIVQAVGILLCAASTAYAQPYRNSARPRGGTVSLGASGIWIGGYDAGDASATETTSSGSPLTLFTTSSKVDGALGGEGRLGVYVSRRVEIEGSFQFSRPLLTTAVSGDFENASPLTAETPVSTYVIGGTARYHFGNGKLAPFVAGGGGYLRQLFEGNVEAVTGSEVHGSGGIDYWFGKRGRRAALRFDAGLSSRSKSVSFEDKRRILPVVGAGFVYLF